MASNENADSDCDAVANDNNCAVRNVPSTQLRVRRSVLQSGAALVAATAATALSGLTNSPESAWAATAATRPPLPDLLYKILRVREATQQEARLIKSGKFKDVQRSNVKLAINFMLNNYRLGDAFVAASAYLDGNQRRVDAGQVGQTAVQNLYTILEYFDSADVQNLKVRARTVRAVACEKSCSRDIIDLYQQP